MAGFQMPFGRLDSGVGLLYGGIVGGVSRASFHGPPRRLARAAVGLLPVADSPGCAPHAAATTAPARAENPAPPQSYKPALHRRLIALTVDDGQFGPFCRSVKAMLELGL